MKQKIKNLADYIRKKWRKKRDELCHILEINADRTNMSTCGNYLFVYDKNTNNKNVCGIYQLRKPFETDELFFRAKINISTSDMWMLLEFLRKSHYE